MITMFLKVNSSFAFAGCEVTSTNGFDTIFALQKSLSLTGFDTISRYT